MTVVGFSFNKISAKRDKPIRGKVNITNNVSIANVEEAKLYMGKTEQKALKCEFEFFSKYEPDFGEIKLNGEVLFMLDEKKHKEALSEWKKGKKLPADLMASVLNNTLSKCNVEALILSRDLNMPPPIPMPKVNVEESK